MKIGPLRTINFFFGTHEVFWQAIGCQEIRGREYKNCFRVIVSPGEHVFTTNRMPSKTSCLYFIKKKANKSA